LGNQNKISIMPDEQFASNEIFNQVLSELEASRAPESTPPPTEETPPPAREEVKTEPDLTHNSPGEQLEHGENDEPREQEDEAEETPEQDLTDIKAKIDSYLKPTGPDDEEEEEAEIDPDYEQYKQYKDNPNVMAVINAVKEGKNLLDIAAELKADDPSKLTLTELFEKDLAKYPSLSESAKKDALEEFDGMSDFNKEKAVYAIRQELSAAHKAKLDQFLVATQQKQTEQDKVKTQYVVQGQQELEGLLQKPEHLGLQMTPERTQKLRDYVLQNCVPDKNGKYNVNDFFKAGLVKFFEKEIIAANTKDVATKAKKEILKDVTRPSKETTGTSGTIVKNDSESASEDWVEQRATAGW
jgi:hypothetical protein